MSRPPAFDDIEAAHQRIAPYIHRTPVFTSRFFNEMTGAHIFFKCENLQRGGAFKIRGATNAVFSLSEDELKNGVLTHSSGNHAQALALAAQWRNAKAYIVMPDNSPQVKADAVKGYGGEVIFCKPTLEAREQTAEKIRKETGAVFIPPYDHPHIIAGQGTAFKELFEDAGQLDYVFTPVGGGGLLSGTSISAKHLCPEIKVMGSEPQGADDAYRSFTSGKLIPSVNPETSADGLLTSLSELTFSIIKKNVDDI
ncbi:MAG TPA: pyridoxal-phosphate dependent enzyme, partial [Chitinophagales bacterium]|nr:pyridoxal-phosphate dependent enzyme [Chitinophagales bacterium]